MRRARRLIRLRDGRLIGDENARTVRALRCFWAISLAGLGMAQTPPPDNSQPSWTQQFSGYFKDLASGSRSYFTQDAWADNLDRLRLTYDGKYRDWLAVHVDYDNEVHAGNLIGPPRFRSRARPPERRLARSPACLREPRQPVLGHFSLSRICFAAQRLGDADGRAPAHRLGDGALLEPHGHVQSDQPAAD